MPARYERVAMSAPLRLRHHLAGPLAAATLGPALAALALLALMIASGLGGRTGPTSTVVLTVAAWLAFAIVAAPAAALAWLGRPRRDAPRLEAVFS